MVDEEAAEEVPTTDGDNPLSDFREVTDARTLRALAHPVRINVLEVLYLHGPLTATEVGERIGESATTCSFHLRQLAKYGFVEEAGGGKGRARPWRVTSMGLQLTADGDDPEANVAASAVGELFRERYLSRYQLWRQSRSSYPLPWRKAASDTEFMLYMTADELSAFHEELAATLLTRYLERLTEPSKRPAGAVPVEMLLFTYPLELPGATSDSEEGS
jgi:DNA-binding transcriptional ArsR family regulator